MKMGFKCLGFSIRSVMSRGYGYNNYSNCPLFVTSMEFKYRFPFQIPTSFLPRQPSDVWHDTDHAKMLLALALRPLVNPLGLISSSDVATSSSTYFLNVCTIQAFQKPQTLLQDKESGFGFFVPIQEHQNHAKMALPRFVDLITQLWERGICLIFSKP